MQPLTALAAPVVARDWGTAPAQRRWTAPRDARWARAPGETTVCESASLRGLPAPEPFVHAALRVTRLGARGGRG